MCAGPSPAGNHSWRLHDCSQLAPVCARFQCKEFIKEEHGQLSCGETSAMSRKKGRHSICRSLLQAQLLCTRRAAQGSREPMLKSIESALLERTNLDETIRLRLKIQAWQNRTLGLASCCLRGPARHGYCDLPDFVRRRHAPRQA